MNRRFAVILGLVSASCAASAFVACSSSDSGGGQDAGADHNAASGDATTDSGPGIDSSTKDSAAPETGSSEGGGTEGGMAEGGPGDGASDASDAGACVLYDASGLDDASVAAGFIQVWQVYKCYKCHQNAATNPVDDAGNGIVLNGNSAGLGDSGLIFPPNLTNSAQGLGCWTDPQVATAILTGHDPEGGTLCPPMPVFDIGDSGGKPMDAGTAQEIIDYIRSLTPSNQTLTDTTCPAPGDGGSDAPTDAPDAG